SSDASVPHRHLHSYPTRRSSDLPAGSAKWADLAQELRKLRRSQDKFIYEPVFVGNFEDAVLGAILNGNLEAVENGPKNGVFEIADRKSTRLNSSHLGISYAVFCL